MERLTDFVSSEDSGKNKQSSGNRSPIYSRRKESEGEQKKRSSLKGPSSKGKAPKPNECFLYGGPHMVRECLQKQALSALTTSIHPPRLDKGKVVALSSNSSESNSDNEESQGPRMGAMRLWNTLRGQVGENIKTKPQKVGSSELMYVDIKLNGRATRAMVDTDATLNFIADREVR